MAESVFPLNILEKEDAPERYQKLLGIDPKYWVSAEEFNKIIGGLNEHQTSLGDIKVALEAYIQTGSKTVQTYAVLPDPSTLTEGTPYKVANDPDETKNGFYSVSNSLWIKDNDLVVNEVNENNFTKGITGLAAVRESLKIAVYQGSHLYFNGTDAKMQLDKDYVLETEGDFIEFKLDILDFESTSRFGVFGKSTAFNEHDIAIDRTGSGIKIYTLKIRGGNTTWTDFILRDKNFYKNTYKVEIGSGATINLYENGKLIDNKEFTGTSIIIKDIAAAYSTVFTKMKLYHLKISSSTGSLASFVDLPQASVPINVIPIQPEVKLHGCYVTYELTASSTGNEKFTIFSRVGKSDKYIRFDVEHELNMDELVYTDQWRLKQAFTYQFDGESMTYTGTLCLQGGESESVYKRTGKDDFTGGYHGDEIVNYAGFYLDGVKIIASDLTKEFRLLPCEVFSYHQRSTTHTSPEGGVPAAGHPVEAIRTKKTSFYDGCYDTEVSYNWQIAISDFEKFYMGISSIGVGFANYGENSKLENIFFNQDGSYVLLDEGGEWMKQYHLYEKRSVIIESTSSINNNVALTQIWDISNYHKFYRDIQNINKPLVANIGDIWKGRTKVSFKL